MSSRKYYYYRRPIVDLSETYQRPIGHLSETYRKPIRDFRRHIGDRHAWSETQWRPQQASSETNLRPAWPIVDRHAPSETDMPDLRPIGDLDKLHRRPIGDPHSQSETDMAHRRPTCPIGDWHANRRPIGDWHVWSETDMPDQRLTYTCLIGDTSESDMHNPRPISLLDFLHYSNINTQKA